MCRWDTMHVNEFRRHLFWVLVSAGPTNVYVRTYVHTYAGSLLGSRLRILRQALRRIGRQVGIDEQVLSPQSTRQKEG